MRKLQIRPNRSQPGPLAARVLTISSYFLIAAASADAGATADAFVPVGGDPKKPLCDRIWDYATLYENPDNPVIQKLVFTGRAQFDYALVDGKGRPKGGIVDDDLDFEDFNIRRLRAGFKATMFKEFTVHAEVDLDLDQDPWYQRLTDAYVAWSPSKEFTLTVGKQGMSYTLDGKTSSKKLLTIDRGGLTGNLWFTSEYLPGVSVAGKAEHWIYFAGIFSKGEEDKEFGNSNAGAAYLVSLGYDLSKAVGADEAVIAVDYMHNEETTGVGPLFTNRSLRSVVSLNGTYQQGPWGIRGDLAAGDGFLGQSDLWGLRVMPYYSFNEHWQVVFRYTFVESDRFDGVRFANGYDSEVLAGGKGDQYQELYAGLNWYICDHRLKVQTGLQYMTMRDQANNGGAFDGWGWTTGLRISW